MPERNFAHFLRRALRKRLRRVLADGPRATGRGRREELHALRIAVKRLRYDLEFAVSLAPKDCAPALRLLALLQERLGALADCDSFEATYAELLADLPTDDERRVGIEGLREAARRDRSTALAAVRTAWNGDGGAPYPEKLAVSISAAVGSFSPKGDS